MKYIMVIISLALLSGCAGMKPIDAHVDIGLLGGIVNVGIGGSIGDGKFEPIVEVNDYKPAPEKEYEELED